MTMRSLCRTVVLLLLGGILFVDADDGGDMVVNHGEAQVEWLRSKGGYFTEKVVVGSVDEDSEQLRFFAAKPISKMEPLVSIPQSAMLTSGGSYDPCDTARNLLHEYTLGEESNYWPYVNYVFSSVKRERFPSAWSKSALLILESILGDSIPPWDWSDNTYQAVCGIPTDHMLETAFAAVLSHGWGHDDLLVPIYGMIRRISDGNAQPRNSNVDSNSLLQRGGRDVHVFASRDIAAGEELLLSFYECTDCYDRITYALPDILKDSGVIQSYPRRWFIPSNHILFEIDEVPHDGTTDGRNELQLTWLTTEEVSTSVVGFLRGLLGRVASLEDAVYDICGKLKDHEGEILTEFYDATKTALQHAVWYTTGQLLRKRIIPSAVDDDTCNESDGKQCALISNQYDNLEKRESDGLDYDVEVCNVGGAGFVNNNYDEVDRVTSHHQESRFMYSAELDDTCLYLNDWLQTCSSFRPHYHEAFVHYPARFIDEVKRVVFIGGGDNMILHEILKYPSIELVVGMELDQQVVRSSFKNMGTQPHFDSEKVQWWFGDAVRTLQMLPQELYGTFDLVLIDLQTYVSEVLKVAEEMSIVDAAVLLMNPETGILARNEDFFLKTSDNYTDYTVGLYYDDVPVICEQSIYMGSNAVDFFKHKQPKDHGIETLIFSSVGDEDFYRFDGWYDYVSNTTRSNPRCIEPGTDHAEVSYRTADNLGVMMILEAEGATAVASSISVQEAISKALRAVDLTEVFVTSKGYSRELEKGGEDLVFVLREGYVVARLWPEFEYCAFDVQLWNAAANRQEALKAALLAAVGSTNRSSSYRFVTGGIHGVGNNEDKFGRVGPRVTETCRPSPNEGSAAETQASEIDLVYTKSMAFIPEDNALIVVLCGEAESGPCSSVGAVSKADSNNKVVPIWTCSSLEAETADGGALQASMAVCETEVLDQIRTSVELHDKIVGIILDPKAPRTMGQILVRISQVADFRRALVSENLVVLGATEEGDAESLWRRELVERFRTDFAMFDPAYEVKVSLSGGASEQSRPIELSVFSGDADFFSKLEKVTEMIETSSSLTPQVELVKNGIKKFVPEFRPTQTPHSTYDATDPLDQWWSQHPLGHQTILQFDVDKPDNGEYEQDEEIYVLHRSTWQPAKFARSRADGRLTVIIDDEPHTTYHLPRERVRRKASGLPDGVVETSVPLDSSQLKVALLGALKEMESIGFTGAESRIQYDVGEGCVVVMFWSSGTCVLAWDGEDHVDVNFFSVFQHQEPLNEFETMLLLNIPYLITSSREEQPRGIGRVVNTIDDVRHREGPHWARTQAGRANLSHW